MHRTLSFVGVAIGMATIVGAAQTNAGLKPATGDVVVADRYTANGVGDIKLLGVCDVHSDSISCWDSHQNPDPKLAKHVSQMLGSMFDEFGSQGVRLTYRYHRKNRLAIFQIPNAATELNSPFRFQGFRQVFAPYSYEANPIVQESGAIQTWCLPIDEGSRTTKSSVFIKLSYLSAPPLDLPLTVGAAKTSGNLTVTVGSIQKEKARLIFNGKTKKATKGVLAPSAWDVVLKLPNETPSSKVNLEVTPVDEKGTEIDSVDDSGRPTDHNADFAKWQTTNWNGFQFFYSDEPGYGEPPPTIGERLRTIKVNPVYVNALHITAWTTRIIEFRDVPLDPK